MMRYLNKDQKSIFRQYFRLSKKSNFFLKDMDKYLVNSVIWNLVSTEGLWGLPIEKQYGGQGLKWEDWVVALEGFFANYFDLNCINLFFSQISVIYIISKYGNNNVKNQYLPRLIKGEMANLFVSYHVHPLLAKHFNYRKNSISFLQNARINITIKRFKSNIVFSVGEKNLGKIPKKICKECQDFLLGNKTYIHNTIDIYSLFDIINFERLLYGIFSSHFIERINKNETSLIA